MKKTNKILSIILAILMVISIIPITASAATYSGKCGDTATWKFDKSTGTLTISGEGYMYIYGEFDIPWYSYTERINKIVINSGIESISDYAFYDCYLLTDITILGDIKYIGSYAFWNCNSLKSITLPDTVTEIDDYAFQSAGLTSITIPDSVIKIGEEAFSCSWLENVSIGSGLATIDSSAFLGCPSLTSIIVDKDNKYFSNDEYGVLFDKEKTVLIKFPLGSNIENYVIPGGVTTIVYNAFEDCGQVLKSVVIPKSVTKIWDYAFTKNHYASFDYFDVYYLGTRADWRKIDFKTFFPTLLDFATIHYAETECICDYKGTVTAPTCTKQGYTRYICANCGDSYIDNYVNALGHVEIIDKGVAPTCTETGISEGKHCSVCNEVLVTQTTVSALGHKGDVVSVTETTCTGQGYTTYKCSVCGDTYNDDYVAALEHNYTWTVIKEPTCNIKGQKIGVCSNCGNEVTESISVVGHNWGERKVDYEPTCTEQGRTCYECSRCGSKTSFQYIPATGHSFGDWELADDAKCGEYGRFECVCSICNQVNVMSAPVEHKYESVVTAPTCTEQGYTTYTCECGDSYVADYVDVDTSNHNHTSEITTPATHTATGIMTYTCACGDSYTEVIAKLENHNYDAVITAPTCTEQGYTTYICECGDSYVDDYVDATGHTPANAVEENYIAPTCTANGSKDVVVYCSVCDEEISRETVTLDATGHADNDGDGYCDADNELLDPSVECDHACHKDGILGFVWRIINVFNMLFGLNKTCSCGVVHY